VLVLKTLVFVQTTELLFGTEKNAVTFGYVVLLRGVVKRSRKRGVVNQTCHVLTPGRGFR